MAKPFCLLVGILPLAAAWGCSGLAPPEKPSFNAAEAGSQALATYDQNGDGKLDAQELDRCPALRMALKLADTDGDGMLSADEIAARTKKWFGTGTTIMNGTTVVTVDGRPLVGATVTFEPEEFLGPSFKTCSGVTDELGRAPVSGADAKFPGVYVGAYRVRISKQEKGREIVPARFNTESTLGYEVAEDNPSPEGLIIFDLAGR